MMGVWQIYHNLYTYQLFRQNGICKQWGPISGSSQRTFLLLFKNKINSKQLTRWNNSNPLLSWGGQITLSKTNEKMKFPHKQKQTRSPQYHPQMIFKSPRYGLPSFESSDLSDQEKFKIHFKDCGRDGQLEFPIRMTLARVWSTSHINASYQVSTQLAFWLKRRSS